MKNLCNPIFPPEADPPSAEISVIRGAKIKFSITLIILFISFLLYPLGYAQNYKYPFGEDNRDPFYPLISRDGQILIHRQVGKENLYLRGVIFSAEKSIAIINEEVFKEGDKIGNYTVFRIEERSVILKKGNEEIVLRLEEE